MFSIIWLTLAAQPGAELTAPPDFTRAQAIICSCASAPAPETVLEGLVVDAELTLRPDGLRANDRQATVFETANAKDRFKVFHSTSQSACGVAFDYGKKYAIPVRTSDDGAYETDFCLMRNGAKEDAATTAADGAQSE